MEHRQYNPEFKSMCLDLFDSNLGVFFDASERQEFSDYLDSLNKDSSYFIGIHDGLVVSCGGLNESSDKAGLTWGMVRRNHHGSGFGTKLTDFRLSKIRENGHINVVLIETSQHTQGFYLKRGFTQTKVVKNGFGKGIDCVSMELNITR
ncbi:GNAT family N-acetyltransferase [Vibrio breoganii]|uniref:GNAT family N-acetyltransferase n=1 Tax=Vibrio breoganii TaxID=553239 RepID=UPI0002D7E8BA|nr:GNAT family N-acetyltransferase [Vibrio breoganii]OED96725.1 GNAT family N-acetyltransferase [Vibrio breoganii ZF-29]OEF82891.1 GNAT family N-acetyltransferase [Vibrio breoganii 1C10]PMH19547.1 GNAT family N-acetyltransferase [Vibrio breoganii]PMM16120.1 GNAT family N-acetyltransferase [Vibrio breoganii]TKG19303.1 GNAT family N-acetyltransferase [Vibrio breoganii]